MEPYTDIRSFLETLPAGVTLVVVSKTRTPREVMKVYEQGHQIFGENRVQEMTGKKDRLPEDIRWHMVGHLQTNKVKYIAPFVHMIQSIDSFKLLSVVDSEARKNNRIIDCLLQVHIAREEGKFGFDEQGIRELLHSETLKELDHVRIRGVMGMATLTSDMEQVRDEFRYLKRLFDSLKSDLQWDTGDFTEVSMGMSGDYRIALEEGSTMIRLGTLIFGPRLE